MLSGTTPSGIVLTSSKCEFSEDKKTVIVQFSGGFTARAGRVACDILFTNADNTVALTSQRFYVIVSESQSGKVITENEENYNELLSLLKEVGDLENNLSTAENDRVKAEAARVAAEKKRVSAERARADAEDVRAVEPRKAEGLPPKMDVLRQRPREPQQNRIGQPQKQDERMLKAREKLMRPLVKQQRLNVLQQSQRGLPPKHREKQIFKPPRKPVKMPLKMRTMQLKMCKTY